MKNVRVIPVLLLKNGGLYKSVKFKDLKYVGDPINAVRIFNDKEVDELVFLDIEVTKNGLEPNYEILSHIAAECFMPLCYGGGLKTLEQIERVLYSGVEKVSINTAAFERPNFIKEASERFGSSTIVVSLDVKKVLFGGYKAFVVSGTKSTKLDPLTYAKIAEDAGAGEILLNSIDFDGTMQGYDLDLINKISSAVRIPVIACGGAGSISDMKNAISVAGASAVAAGSFFVFQGRHRAVLITYPEKQQFRA